MDLSLPDQNMLTYVYGYLMKKCLEKHSCDFCINYIHLDDTYNSRIFD